MEKYDVVYIIDYCDLEIELFEYGEKRIFDFLNDVKNDTIYNTYPYKVRPYQLTKENIEYICAFANWLAANKEFRYFSDFYENKFVDESVPEIILNLLCTLGQIPEGNYFMRISW